MKQQRALKARFILASNVTAACAFALATLSRGEVVDDSSPIFGVKLPAGYRNWELIAPSHEAGGFNELRGILGNAIAMKAYRGGAPPPDGAILAKLARKQEPSTEFEGAFVPGRATTVQIMVKDSKK
jgi:Cytochrome P460